MNYNTIRNDIETLVKMVAAKANETAIAWGWYEVGHIMARIVIINGVDIEYALTDGNRVQYADNLGRLAKAVEWELNQGIDF